VLGGAVLDDGLGDGGDVVVVEASGEGTAAMAGGAKGDALGWDVGVWVQGIVGGDEAGDVDEIFGQGRLAGLVWRLDCGAAAHALVCLVVGVCVTGLWVTIWDAGCGAKWGGRTWDSRMIRKWQGKVLVFWVWLA